jgi:hypothetical protein
MAEHPLPEHLADLAGWVEVEGLGWLREVIPHDVDREGIDFWWWHHCPPAEGEPGYNSPRTIDCSSGERHAIISGTLAGGDLTIHGGTGSIPCDRCGLHGWLRDGRWVPAGEATDG